MKLYSVIVTVRKNIFKRRYKYYLAPHYLYIQHDSNKIYVFDYLSMLFYMKKLPLLFFLYKGHWINKNKKIKKTDILCLMNTDPVEL